MKNLKLSKTTYPTDQPSQDQWFRQFGVASAYIKPTPYYEGNRFDTKVFLGQTRSSSRNLFGKVVNRFYNILNLFTWVG